MIFNYNNFKHGNEIQNSLRKARKDPCDINLEIISTEKHRAKGDSQKKKINQKKIS